MKICQHQIFPDLQCIISIRLTAVRAQVILEKEEKDAHNIHQLSNVCVYINYGSNLRTLCVCNIIHIDMSCTCRSLLSTQPPSSKWVGKRMQQNP